MSEGGGHIALLSGSPGVALLGGGGGSRHVQFMAAAFGQLGHHVTALSPRLRLSTQDERRDPPFTGRVVQLRLPDLPLMARWPALREWLSAASLRRQVLEQLRRTPPTLIYERHSLFCDAGLAAARELGVPWVLEINAPQVEERSRYFRLGLRALGRRWERRLVTSADLCVVVSHPLASRLAGLGVDPARILVEPNGVDPQMFSPGEGERVLKEFLGLGGAGPVIGFVGTLKPWHGLEVLLDAFALLRQRLPGAVLLLVGHGPLRGELEVRARRLGLAGRVRWAGQVDVEGVVRHLRLCDMAVSPAPAEGGDYFSPLKITEYLACGVPVVAADRGDNRQLLGGGEAGVLVPPGESAALALALTELWEQPLRRQMLREEGLKVAGGRRWEQIAARVLARARELPRQVQ